MITFEEWLTQNHQNAEERLNAFGMLSILCRKEKLTKTSLQQIEHVEEITWIQKILDDRLQEYGEEYCTEFQDVLSLYAQYLKQNEDNGNKETLMDAICRCKIPFVDKRTQGGALWIIYRRKRAFGLCAGMQKKGRIFSVLPGRREKHTAARRMVRDGRCGI